MKRLIRNVCCSKWSVFVPEHVNAVVLEMNSNLENLINDSFYNDFHEALDTIEADFEKYTPLVLTSEWETGIFSHGLDISWLQQIPDNGEEINVKINNIFERLYLLERPTIAACNGNAFGGGFILRFVEPAFEFLTVAPKIGLPYPSSVYHIMKYEIPYYKKFLLTGDKVDGNTAIKERISLKHKKGALDDALDYIGNEILSPKAFTKNKISLKIGNYEHFQETEGVEIDRKYIEATKEEGLRERIEGLIEKNKDL